MVELGDGQQPRQRAFQQQGGCSKGRYTNIVSDRQVLEGRSVSAPEHPASPWDQRIVGDPLIVDLWIVDPRIVTIPGDIGKARPRLDPTLSRRAAASRDHATIAARSGPHPRCLHG